jgi:hypothetical protein
MIHEGWACNPGSPENCDLQESLYDQDKRGNTHSRGYALVEIDPTGKKPLRELQIRSNPRRPVAHLTLDCTPFGNKLKDGARFLEQAAAKLIIEAKVTSDAAVALRLTGKVNLDRIALDVQTAAQNIQEAIGVKAVALDATSINLGAPGPNQGDADSAMSREDIERASIRSLVEEEHLWGLDGEQEAIANLFFELKEGVRTGQTDEELAELIQVSPLVDKIRAAKDALAPSEPPLVPTATGGAA